MATRLQLRRGTAAENTAYSGAEGEITYATDTKQVFVHDGNGTDIFIDPVVAFQRPTVANNWTWYRKYASGWVEQGGYFSNNTSGVFTVDIPVAMSNWSYTVTATLRSNSVSGSGGSWVNANALNQSQIQLVQDYATTWVGWGSYWRVEGFAAQ